MEDTLVSFLRTGVERGICTGAGCGVVHRTAEYLAWYGKRDAGGDPLAKGDFFDLASLTKPLATTLAVMALVAVDGFDLHRELAAFPCLAPWLEAHPDKARMTPAHLLCHTSGLPAWLPLHTALADLPQAERWPAAIQKILAEPLTAPPGTATLYSDLGFILLGWLVEQEAGMDLQELLVRQVYQPLGLEWEIFFNKPWQAPVRPGNYVATRATLTAGAVEDDNARMLGGVCGHAGLFGSIIGVTRLAAALLAAWQGHRVLGTIPPTIVQTFLDHEEPQGRALGFDRPSGHRSAAGRHFGRRAVGHLGFTGTSVWLDPDRDLAVVLLTNRVRCQTVPRRIRAYRAWFHDRVHGLL